MAHGSAPMSLSRMLLSARQLTKLTKPFSAGGLKQQDTPNPRAPHIPLRNVCVSCVSYT